MSYRFYFYEISKSEIDKIKDMTKKELLAYMKEIKPEKVDESNYFSFSDMGDQKLIYEFGKIYDESYKQIYSTGKPLFNKPDMQKEFEYYDPYVCGKEAVIKAIEIYKGYIIDYYRSLLNDEEDEDGIPKQRRQESHIHSTLKHWERNLAVNTDLSKECISSSWKYEYQIFELVRLLKSIDWDKKVVLFYGY